MRLTLTLVLMFLSSAFLASMPVASSKPRPGIQTKAFMALIAQAAANVCTLKTVCLTL